MTDSADPCDADDMFDILLLALRTNISVSDCIKLENPPVPITYRRGRLFYVYVTPVILFTGIVGNVLSLKVFLSRNLRGKSASSYLAALSISDLMSLIFYVTVEWLRRGLVYVYPNATVPLLDSEGVCQVLMYLSYISRFLSSWLVVAFTFERYIGVCHPLRRRLVCDTSNTRRIIISLCLVSLVIVMYKPFLSGVYVSADGTRYCTSNKVHHLLSFALDSTFALLITLVPFTIITVLNIFIVKRVLTRNKRHKIEFSYHRKRLRRIFAEKCHTDESLIKIEFTLILLSISFFFVTFNLPYFSIWFRNFLYNKYISRQESMSTEHIEYWQGLLYVTRAIFYMNYCVNFFLYSITGSYFRREVKRMFTNNRRRGSFDLVIVNAQFKKTNSRCVLSRL